MRLLIFSDDLTGASGVASMIGFGRSITVDRENLVKIDLDSFDNISVNLALREADSESAGRVMSEMLHRFRGYRIALRIDSTLRGNIPAMVGSIAEVRPVLITDTIPEYGRFTRNGMTVASGDGKSIMEALGLDGHLPYTGNITIRDSMTYEDLDSLADLCVDRNMVPIDPGPMIALYARKLEDEC